MASELRARPDVHFWGGSADQGGSRHAKAFLRNPSESRLAGI